MSLPVKHNSDGKETWTELEQQLSEQRGLTQAIALQGSRARPHDPPPGGAGPGVAMVTDSFTGDGAAKQKQSGSETQTVKELQALTRALRALGPAETADSGLFQVLHRTPSCLSAIRDVLRWTAGGTEDEDGRRRRLLQTLTSELDALGAALTCQRSKFSGGQSSCVPQCLDDAFRVLSVIRASLTFREKRLGDLKQENIQQTAQVSSGDLSASSIHQVSQGEPDQPPAGVCCHGNQEDSGVELQHHHEQLVHSLEELLALGRDRLDAGPEVELRDRAGLRQQHAGHMKFLQFLDRHFRTLQYLSQSAPQRWEGGLQEEVWSQWEEDSAWADSLLRPLQTSFPSMQEEGASEEQISEKLSVYKGIREVLENNEARFALFTWRLDPPVNRFLHDFDALVEWMGGARRVIDTLDQLSGLEEVDADLSQRHFVQAVVRWM
ncbi:hypothetical protein fugu_016810 [Takifugu bimaculatus]|uniref:Uncharacterized protein n=1 Tax=Takifugu bimaculatus TaxID=433685 RepID=A0A4Z2BV57_9TELE|nr:hypothetical protein fugu_016810 [Takifugu bimaculatus]